MPLIRTCWKFVCQVVWLNQIVGDLWLIVWRVYSYFICIAPIYNFEYVLKNYGQSFISNYTYVSKNAAKKINITPSIKKTKKTYKAAKVFNFIYKYFKRFFICQWTQIVNYSICKRARPKSYTSFN